ncbi:MAG: ABC transporter permease subunit [Anaerolineae bacterium]|nr:ABC transporter permease subunit [Anaerolineae bacterium]MDW8173722.1 ABC transporter permease subunit [Anaerolineae bacterium]
MLLQNPFAPRDVARTGAPRPIPSLLADAAVLLGVLLLLYAAARIGAGALVSFQPPTDVPEVSLDPANLPYYGARSTLRMFIALAASLIFTFIYGYIAAKSRRAERVLIPLLDVLQSVPVLGFLSITVTGFIALFPGSLLGLEMASIFAIFTGQVWNMTFSFYHSLKSLPRELDEAATLYRLPRWQRFFKLEVPAATIGLLWNAMMSFGGGWFFVAASEAISVLNQEYTLPGLGSYVAAAVAAEDLGALGLAILTMGFIIVAVDQLFWRPLVAWADKFKLERSAAAEAPRSWVLDILRASSIPGLLAAALAPLGEAFNNLIARRAARREAHSRQERPTDDRLYSAVLVLIVISAILLALDFILRDLGLEEVFQAVLMGCVTFLRVLVLLVVSTLVWVPIGVAIGFNPRLSQIAQPVVQFLASFPANFLFPFATLFFIRAGVELNWGGILLMSLGAQWYVLFNTIAGAMSIPSDLREMARNMGVRGWQLWRSLIIPGIFGAWVTGGITATGGAWNASIVAEIVSWGNTTLRAYGLGEYISVATEAGDWPRIVLGVGLMCMFVVGLNRIFWRRLYDLAERRYRLG